MVISVLSSQDTEIYKDNPSPVYSFVEDLNEIMVDDEDNELTSIDVQEGDTVKLECRWEKY